MKKNCFWICNIIIMKCFSIFNFNSIKKKKYISGGSPSLSYILSFKSSMSPLGSTWNVKWISPVNTKICIPPLSFKTWRRAEPFWFEQSILQNTDRQRSIFKQVFSKWIRILLTFIKKLDFQERMKMVI